MGTFLFDKIIFGPVQSRRLGVSLGVNLLPIDGKVCTFDCIYCECGLNSERRGGGKMPNAKEVYAELDAKLKEMRDDNLLPDVITFAGNGEPTVHPQFAEIIDETLKLRDKFCPKARVAVLTNSTMIGKESVFLALGRVDDNIVKLDSAIDSTIEIVDNPSRAFTASDVITGASRFKGACIVQTMFLRGVVNGTAIDNTTDVEVEALIDAIGVIKPKQVMIYSLDRDTPVAGLEKVLKSDLDAIADRIRERLQIEVSVSG